MKRMACGTAATLALVGLAACFSNPANDLNTDNFHIVQATPAVTFTKIGDSVQLRLRLVNDVLNGTITSFVVSGVPAGISVRYDDKFRPYYLNGADTLSVPVDKDMQQYYIKGLAAGKYTFTVTATANPSAPAATITVNVEAKNVLTNKSAALNVGDTVTLTTPAGTVFSQTSAVTFGTGSGVVAVRAADSSSIKVILGSGVSGVATVTKIGTLANLAITPASVTTAESFTTPTISTAPTTVSATTIPFGGSFTATLGNAGPLAPIRFRTGAATATIGGRSAFITNFSADSSTATIIPIGVLSGALAYTNLAFSYAPGTALSLPSDKTITIGAAPAADPNATSVATASTFVMPAAVGGFAVLADQGAFTAGASCTVAGGGVGCRYYKIVVPATATFTVNLSSNQTITSDEGVYLLNAAGTALIATAPAADAFGAQAGSPESSTWVLAPGTYVIAVVNYTAANPVSNFFEVLFRRTN